MALNKQKKLEYIEQILEEVKNGSVDDKEDSILIDVALDFIEDLKEGNSDGTTGGWQINYYVTCKTRTLWKYILRY